MDIHRIEFLGLVRVLQRGSGEILAEQEDVFLVRDRISGACLLACDDLAAGLCILDRHIGRNCDLLMVSDFALGQAAFVRYGFSEKLECYQVAYYGDQPPVDTRISVRVAEEKDLPMLIENYRLLSPEELRKVVRRRSILLGYDQDQLIGFIGEHLEGSMGILYVLPAFRHRGFGTALQAHLMVKTMEEGYIPFGQVEKDNRASLCLQQKLGMSRSENLIVWMWR